MFDEPPLKEILALFIVPALAIVIWVIVLCMMNGCTLNMTNISTNGKADDVVDEQVSPTNTVNPNLKITPGFQ